jgi:hypothetical protein
MALSGKIMEQPPSVGVILRLMAYWLTWAATAWVGIWLMYTGGPKGWYMFFPEEVSITCN